MDSGSVAERILPLRRRRDLVVEPLRMRGQRRWHLKDPLTLHYWQFGDEELFLWQQLDGGVGLAEWQRRFQQRFAPRRIERPQLHSFLGMLHREGLVVATAPGQAVTLLERRAEQRRRHWFSVLTNPLAIRFRGFDPEPLLARVYPVMQWLFHPFAVLVAVIWMLSAAVLVGVHWNQFWTRLPDASAYLAASNIAWLVTALAIAKVLHELGHALACKHFGGECRELGLMLLIFTPCLYCNVSDMWLVPEKWRRMAVSAAGMYVELLLAATATWLWWWSVPGSFQSLCLALMSVCSVSTLVFNGNPLLRYDGYFMLSDWLELPNLRAAADSELRATVARLVGVETEPEHVPTGSQERAWLLGFAVASLAYRLAITVVILWFLHRWLTALRLEQLSVVVLVAVLICQALPALQQVRGEFQTPRRRRVFPWQLALSAFVSAVVLGLLLLVPWPNWVAGPATLRPAEATAVYVTVAGRLVTAVEPGTRVRQGDPLAELRNDDLDVEITRLQGECAVWERQRDSLRRQQVQDSRTGVASTAGQLQSVEQSLWESQQQLRQKLSERDQLIIRAPCNGTIVAPPPRPRSTGIDELARWSGSPLDPCNRGCFLDTGTLLAYTGHLLRREALVLVEQAEMSTLATGQSVRLQLAELPGQSLDGRVAAIGVDPCQDAPPDLVARHQLPIHDHGASVRLLGTYFPVRVELSDDSGLPLGSSGRARIWVAPQSLGQRLYNAVYRTFRFRSL